MKQFLILLFWGLTTSLIAGAQSYTVMPLSLPPELSWYNNQFSGLYVHSGQLFLLSESRLQDKAEGKLYGIPLPALNRKLKDTACLLPYQKYHLYNLEALYDKIQAAGQEYEGLEAMVIKGTTIYLSVETATPSPYAYLLRGALADTAVWMDTSYLLPLPKPVNRDGSHIYNAAFEATALYKDRLFLFFEYNYFPQGNYVYGVNLEHPGAGRITPRPMQPLPFRITDITRTGSKQYTAINYFYKGGEEDSVYWVPPADAAYPLTRGAGGYQNYCRLIRIRHTSKGFRWEPLPALPFPYSGYNWEGIAAYKRGYFLINDKYTPAKPYVSTLLYIKEK